mmetsp:Transcript_24754/g.49250  ORF Transcript_24754/g.49250 Transcript_24754/m.49250 type:complete len:173 (+) Transcript_24754:87-605(+)
MKVFHLLVSLLSLPYQGNAKSVCDGCKFTKYIDTKDNGPVLTTCTGALKMSIKSTHGKCGLQQTADQCDKLKSKPCTVAWKIKYKSNCDCRVRFVEDVAEGAAVPTNVDVPATNNKFKIVPSVGQRNKEKLRCNCETSRGRIELTCDKYIEMLQFEYTCSKCGAIVPIGFLP